MTTSLTERDRSIVTQVAAKIAADIVVKAYDPEAGVVAIAADVNEMVGLFVSTTDQINQAIQQLIIEQTVTEAFPGSQTLPEAAPSNVVPLRPATEVPNHIDPASFSNAMPQGDVAIPGATQSPTETLWRQYFADPSKWWDNRKDKRKPTAPDFKLKSDGDVALWIVGRNTPSWVAGALRGESF